MKAQITAALLLAFSLAACASAGNQALKNTDVATIDQKIVDNKSTKADVKAIFGPPMDTSFTDSGNEIWKYAYAFAAADGASYIPIVGIFAGGVNVDKKELVILFDKDGVVTKHTMTVSKDAVKRGG